jgi:hypothetical protein
MVLAPNIIPQVESAAEIKAAAMTWMPGMGGNHELE